MGDWTIVERLTADFGVTGIFVLFIVLFCRLIDKWAARFLDVQTSQSVAMEKQASGLLALAGSIKESAENEREILAAVRLLAERIDRQKDNLIRIEEKLQERG
jgi:hypothetical protein